MFLAQKEILRILLLLVCFCPRKHNAVHPLSYISTWKNIRDFCLWLAIQIIQNILIFKFYFNYVCVRAHTQPHTHILSLKTTVSCNPSYLPTFNVSKAGLKLLIFLLCSKCLIIDVHHPTHQLALLSFSLFILCLQNHSSKEGACQNTWGEKSAWKDTCNGNLGSYFHNRTEIKK